MEEESIIVAGQARSFHRPAGWWSAVVHRNRFVIAVAAAGEARMGSDSTYVAMHRPERDLASRWGIYSTSQQRWLDVHFVTRAEAEQAIHIINARRMPAKNPPQF